MSSETLDPIFLGSRSPRRSELLACLIPRSRIELQPPADEDEPGFDDCATRDEVLRHLAAIARAKNDAVVHQLGRRPRCAVLTADTTVIAGAETPVVLGKPDGPDWQNRVRDWFRLHYFGRTHTVATAVCLTDSAGLRREVIVETLVTFCREDRPLLEWYLATGDPLGKAGGYGIQSGGGMFVTEVRGSLSNVVGLPLRETWELLRQAGVLTCPGSS